MKMDTSEAFVPLGKTDQQISPIGLGTWSWGDRLFWAYGVTHSSQDVEAAFDTSIEAGINFIDTAEIYGFGGSEKLLGRLIQRTNRELVITSKLFPYPWRLSTKSLIQGLRGTLRRLGVDAIDLYMMHWPLPPIRVERWTESIVNAYEEGLIRAIGVSNYNLSQMRRAQEVLDKHGLQLSASQFHFSLLHHKPEKSGYIQACLEDEVTIIAYSPLGQGLLTGKYSPGSPLPKGMMRLGNRSIIEKIQPLIGLMRDLGVKHNGKTPAQVAINWTLRKGTVPIVGAKNQRQAAENAGSYGWSLLEEEIHALDVASQGIQLSFPMSKIARA
jgi:aryl-alcohol dehydrogenase-like predicted oxidoreductase